MILHCQGAGGGSKLEHTVPLPSRTTSGRHLMPLCGAAACGTGGCATVVGIMFEMVDDSDAAAAGNDFLQTIWSVMPPEEGVSLGASQPGCWHQSPLSQSPAAASGPRRALLARVACRSWAATATVLDVGIASTLAARQSGSYMGCSSALRHLTNKACSDLC